MTFGDILGSLNAADGLQVLMNVTIKTAVTIPLSALVVFFLMRRTSAASRHVVWLLTIGVVVAAPLLGSQFSGTPMFTIGTAQQSEPAPNVEPSAVPYVPASGLDRSTELPDTPLRRELPVSAPADQPAPTMREPIDAIDTTREFLASDQPQTAAVLADVESPVTPAQSSPVGIRTWARPIVIVWTAGVLVMLSLLAATQVWMIWKRRTYSVGNDDRLAQMCRAAAAEIGLVRNVMIFISQHDSMPMTWGIMKPGLLLPASAATWSDERLRMVLLHELSHVKRFDCLWQFVSVLTIAVHWFNPLVWMAAVRLQIECEQACDDVVLVSGVSGPDYAEQLLDISTGGRRGVLAMCAGLAMARSHRLASRVRAIVDCDRDRSPASGRLLASLVLGAVLVILPAAALTRVAVVADAAGPEEQRAESTGGEEGSEPDSPPGRQQTQRQRYSAELPDGSLVDVTARREFVQSAIRLVESASVEIPGDTVEIPEPKATLLLSPPVRIKDGETDKELAATQIMVGTGNPLGPDYLLIRVDNRFRQFAKFDLQQWLAFQSELERLVFSRGGTITPATGEWSNPANGLSARLSVEDRRHPMIGVFLELKNVSDVGNTMVVPLDADRIRFELRDVDGQSKPELGGRRSGPVVEIGSLNLPFQSSIRVNLSLANVGIRRAAGAMVVVRNHDWVIQNDNLREYRLRASFSAEPTDRNSWHGSIDVPPVSVQLAKTQTREDRRVQRRYSFRHIEGPHLVNTLQRILPRRASLSFRHDEKTKELIVDGHESQHVLVRKLLDAMGRPGRGAELRDPESFRRQTPEFLKRMVDRFFESGPLRFELERETQYGGAVTKLPSASCRFKPPSTVWRQFAQTFEIIDYDRGHRLLLDPVTKKAFITTDIPLAAGGHLFDNIRKARHAPSDDCESLGTKVIHGVTATGYRVAVGNHFITLWGDSKSAAPVAIEDTESQASRSFTYSLSKLSYDITVRKSLFDLTPPESYQVTVTHNHAHPGAADETDFVAMLRAVTSWNDGEFPEELTPAHCLQPLIARTGLSTQSMPSDKLQRTSLQAAMTLDMGFKFVRQWANSADIHYAGRGVRVDEPARAVFWFRPLKRGPYRVISSDFSLKDLEQPPNAANAVRLLEEGKIVALSSVIPASYRPAKAARDGSDPPWGDAVEGIRIRVRPTNRAFHTNEPAGFSLDVRNDSGKDFLFVRNATACSLQIDGRWYWRRRTTARGLRLKSGTAKNDAISFLLGESEKWLDKSRGTPLRLSPGRHTLRVALARDIGFPSKEPVSNRIEFAILANDAETGMPDDQPPAKAGKKTLHSPKLSQAEIGQWVGKVLPSAAVPREIVLRGLISDHLGLRADCARYLASRGDWKDVPFLVEALSDNSSHEGDAYDHAGKSTTRYWVNVALIAITKEDLGFRWDDSEVQRQTAIESWRLVAGSSRWKSGVPIAKDVSRETVLRDLASAQTSVRHEAVRSMATVGQPSDTPQLIDALSDDSVLVGGKYDHSGKHTVRYWANVALIAIHKNDYSFRWDDPVEKRHQAIDAWKLRWRNRKAVLEQAAQRLEQAHEHQRDAEAASDLSVAIGYSLEATVGPGVIPDEKPFASVTITNRGNARVSAPATWWSMQAIVDGKAHEMLPERRLDWSGPGEIIADGKLRSAVSMEEFEIDRETLSAGWHTFQIRVGKAASNSLVFIGGSTQPNISTAGNPVPGCGDEIEGVIARLRLPENSPAPGATPTLLADVVNQGSRTFGPFSPRQPLHEIEIDGVWYRWDAKVRVLSAASFPPDTIHNGIEFTLDGRFWAANPGQAADNRASKRLALAPGKHTARVAIRVDEGRVRAISNRVEFELHANAADRED